MPNLIVCGATGRVGALICESAAQDPFWSDILLSNRSKPLTQVITEGDILIDFTLPEGTAENVRLACEHQKPIVIGTTGFNEIQTAQIREAAQKIPVVLAPNMSVGVNVLFQLIEEATRMFGNNFKIAIEETHHIHKKDKPSGTAKEMGVCVQQNGGEIDEIRSNREGEMIGDHTIQFASPTEILNISHHAIDRKI